MVVKGEMRFFGGYGRECFALIETTMLQPVVSVPPRGCQGGEVCNLKFDKRVWQVKTPIATW